MSLPEAKLGFGCVKLTANFTEKAALKNLSTAYECGIRHFDTARLYGFGLAESILGKFIKDKRQEITITTKFGINPKKSPLQNLFVQNLVRNIYKTSSFFRKSGKVISGSFSQGNCFNVEDAEVSLNTSLKQLNTDYVDFLLLHEPSVSQANNEDLISFLKQQQQKGKIINIGIGSFSNVIPDIDDLSAAYNTIQTDLSFPIGLNLSTAALQNRKIFYFSPFRYINQLKTLFIHKPEIEENISEILDWDVKNNVVALCLMMHKTANIPGTTLFTSSDNNKIIATANSWNKNSFNVNDINHRMSLVQKLIFEHISLS